MARKGSHLPAIVVFVDIVQPSVGQISLKFNFKIEKLMRQSVCMK